MDPSREEEETESAQWAEQKRCVNSSGTPLGWAPTQREEAEGGAPALLQGGAATVPSLKGPQREAWQSADPWASITASVSQHPPRQDVGPGARVGPEDTKAEPLLSTLSQAGRGNKELTVIELELGPRCHYHFLNTYEAGAIIIGF